MKKYIRKPYLRFFLIHFHVIFRIFYALTMNEIIICVHRKAFRMCKNTANCTVPEKMMYFEFTVNKR